MKGDLGKSRAELTAAGFRPAPFRQILWGIRKLLWPLIRQYHFFHLEQAVEFQQEVDSRDQQFQASLGALRADLEALRAHADSTSARVDSTSARVDSTSARVDLAESSDHQLQAGLTALRSEVANLRAVGEAATRQQALALEALKTYAQSSGARIEALELRDHRVQGSLADMRLELENLRVAGETAALQQASAIQALRAEANSSSERIESTFGHLDTRLHDLRSMYSAQINAMAAALSALRGELNQRTAGAEDQYRQLTDELSRRNHSSQELERRLNELTDEVGKTNSTHLEFRTDLVALVNRQGRLSSELTSRFQSQQEETGALSGRLNELASVSLVRIDAVLKALNGQVAAASTVQTTVSERVSQLAASLVSLTERVGNLSASGESVAASLRNTIEASRQLEETQLRLASHLPRQDERLGLLDAQIQELQLFREDHVRTFQQLVAATGELDDRLTGMLSQVEAAHAELDALSQADRADEVRDGQLQAGLEALTARLEQLDSKSAELGSSLEEVQSAANLSSADMAAKLADVVCQSNELRGHFQRYVAHYSGLRGELARLTSRQQNSDTALAAFREVVEATLNELREIAPRTTLLLTGTSNGLMVVKAGEVISDQIRETGAWDPEVQRAIVQWSGVRQGLAIDVGGHIGSTMLTMARHYPRVVSFEPNRFNFRLLQANVSINGLTHVDCRNVALSSRPSRQSIANQELQEVEIPLNSVGDFDGLKARNLGAYSFSELGTNISAVDAVTLDSFNFEDVAIIKIDVQGADGEVIMGALSTIRRWRPCIIFEWERSLSSHYTVTFEQVLECLQALDYEVDPLKQTNEKQADYIARPKIPPPFVRQGH